MQSSKAFGCLSLSRMHGLYCVSEVFGSCYLRCICFVYMLVCVCVHVWCCFHFSTLSYIWLSCPSHCTHHTLIHAYIFICTTHTHTLIYDPSVKNHFSLYGYGETERARERERERRKEREMSFERNWQAVSSRSNKALCAKHLAQALRLRCVVFVVDLHVLVYVRCIFTCLHYFHSCLQLKHPNCPCIVVCV